MPVEYSPMAEGWPTFENTVTRTINGRAHPSVGRYDYISKYSINYGLLTRPLHDALRQFYVLRQCGAQGFRFLAPDHNSVTQTLAGTIVVGTQLYKLYETYSDAENTYIRRIIKLSGDPLTIRIHNTDVPITETAWNDAAHELPSQGAGTISGQAVAVDYNLGKVQIEIATALAHDGHLLKWTGGFHIPVMFIGNPRGTHDLSSEMSDFNLEELLETSLV